MKGRGENFWQEVRRAYENGEGSYQTLADRFGVSRGAMASHGRAEGWNRKKQEATDLQEMTGKLSRAAMREIGRLEEGEADVKTIRELTALLKELNQLMKSAAEENGESTVRVQWEEDMEQWSE
jgi:hypothetical protein|nr:MAG TPA: Protein of unknown function (DUF1804) [Caudoviricetes sp.]